MGYEYEVDTELLSNAATTMSGYAFAMSGLATEVGGTAPPKPGVCGESIASPFSTMTTAWKAAFNKLETEMTDLSKAVNGSTKMYIETEREVRKGFGQFAQ